MRYLVLDSFNEQWRASLDKKISKQRFKSNYGSKVWFNPQFLWMHVPILSEYEDFSFYIITYCFGSFCQEYDFPNVQKVLSKDGWKDCGKSHIHFTSVWWTQNWIELPPISCLVDNWASTRLCSLLSDPTLPCLIGTYLWHERQQSNT